MQLLHHKSGSPFARPKPPFANALIVRRRWRGLSRTVIPTRCEKTLSINFRNTLTSMSLEVVVAALTTFALTGCVANKVISQVPERQGSKAYMKQDYQEAADKYADAAEMGRERNARNDMNTFQMQFAKNSFRYAAPKR